MKVGSSRARKITNVVASVAVAAMVLSMAVGSGFLPPEAAEAAVLWQQTATASVQADAVDAATFDAHGKSEALAAAAPALKTVGAQPAQRKAPTPLPAKRSSKKSAKVAAANTTGGWKSAKVSWYGPGFYGNTMAGGGKLTKTSMVVAHRSLPFGTRIEFKYNGKTCIAVVKDRGPYAGGRVFDLGPGTAKSLGFSGVGTVQYRILG